MIRLSRHGHRHARCDDARCSQGSHPMAEHDHDHHHEHGSELSETQLRVRALETVLTEKGYIDPAALDLIIEAYETKIGPAQRRARRRQGLERSGLQAGAARRRLQGGAHARPREPGRRPSGRGREHAASSTTWSSARCAPVIRGRCSACRRSGTSRRPTARARSRTRAACSPISASSCRRRPQIRVWDSTAETRFIVLPMRPAGTEGWSEERLARWSPAIRMIGTGLAKRPEEVA